MTIYDFKIFVSFWIRINKVDLNYSYLQNLSLGLPETPRDISFVPSILNYKARAMMTDINVNR